MIRLPVPVIGAGHLHVVALYMRRWPAFLAAVTCAVSAVVFVSYVVTALTAHVVVGWFTAARSAAVVAVIASGSECGNKQSHASAR